MGISGERSEQSGCHATIGATAMEVGAGSVRGDEKPEGGVYDGHDGLQGAMSEQAGLAEIHHRARRCARGRRLGASRVRRYTRRGRSKRRASIAGRFNVSAAPQWCKPCWWSQGAGVLRLSPWCTRGTAPGIRIGQEAEPSNPSFERCEAADPRYDGFQVREAEVNGRARSLSIALSKHKMVQAPRDVPAEPAKEFR